MARTGKTTESAVVVAAVAPKRRGRPPKAEAEPIPTAETGLVTEQKITKKPAKNPRISASEMKAGRQKLEITETLALQTESPIRKPGRPKKTEKSKTATEIEATTGVVEHEAKPGLVGMAPLTKVKANRRSEIISISDEPERRRGRPVKRVMPIQQEQILAEELNSKVLADDRHEAVKGRKHGVRSMKAQAKTEPEKPAEPAMQPPRIRGRPPKQPLPSVSVSVPPTTVTARRSRKLRITVTAFIVLVFCAVGGYIYTSHRPVEAVSSDAKIIQQVSTKAILPTDESPSISTVVDATAVNQPFLKGAKNGDKVLLYFQAGRAIVFRPSTGQIVNMGTLQQPQPKVFIRQGAQNADLSKIGAEITASGQFAIASHDLSPLNNYDKTVVVDVAGNRPDIANQLANVLHATVAKMPAGESAPDSDLLVIVGRDNPVK